MSASVINGASKTILCDTDGNPIVIGTGSMDIVTIGGTVPVSATSLPLPTGAATEASFTSSVGEVQANPTANTILARLKDLLSLSTIAAGEHHIGQVGGCILTPTATFTRPAGTLTYASGQLIANHASAGSVTPLAWDATRVAAGSAELHRVRMLKSTTSTTNAQFRLHLYTSDPSTSGGGSVTNGDGGNWLTQSSGYIGACDITLDKVFSDGARGNGVPNIGSEMRYVLGSGTLLYGLLEARAAYSAGAAEVFTLEVEVLAN